MVNINVFIMPSNYWNNESTFRFLELYQGEAIIWDPKHKYHKDKTKVNDAWFRICVQMEIAVAELKKKKESLMACFRSHLKRKKASIKSGAGAGDVYKPIWTFYEVMETFLGGIYECTPTISTEDNAEQSQTEEDVDSISDNASTSANLTPTVQKPLTLMTPAPRRPSSLKGDAQSQRRFVSNPELQEAGKQMKEAFSTLSNVINARSENMAHKEDECDLYGKLLATKLRKLPEREREEAMYEIHGLMLEKLRSKSRNVTDNRPFSQSQISSRETTVSSPMTSSYSAPSPTQVDVANHTLTTFDTYSASAGVIHEYEQVHDQPTSKIRILSTEILPADTNLLHYAYNRALQDEVIESEQEGTEKYYSLKY